MKRYFVAGALLLMAVAAIAAPYAAPKVFVPGGAIMSSDFNAMNVALAASINSIATSQLADSAVTSGKLATGAAAGNLGNDSIRYNMINYTDSTGWDTLPMKSETGQYIGGGALQGVATLLNIQRFEIIKVHQFGTDQLRVYYDADWTSGNTTLYVDSGSQHGFYTGVVAKINPSSPKSIILYGGVDPNIDVAVLGDTYYYTVWGY